MHTPKAATAVEEKVIIIAFIAILTTEVRICTSVDGKPTFIISRTYAFSYPQRLKASFPRLDFKMCTNLTFEQPDTTRFRNLALAYEALHKGGNMPCIVNAANEVVVAAFLRDEISFLGMSDVIEKAMSIVSFVAKPEYEDYVATDAMTRRIAQELIK